MIGSDRRCSVIVALLTYGSDDGRPIWVDAVPGPGFCQLLQSVAEKIDPAPRHRLGGIGIDHADRPERESQPRAGIRPLQIEGGHSDSDAQVERARQLQDRKSTRLNSSHVEISYAVFCLKKKKKKYIEKHLKKNKKKNKIKE